MTVAVAHQASASSKTLALHEAGRQAHDRGTGLAVLHVIESLDGDIEAAYRSSLDAEIETALAEVNASDVTWQVHLATAPDDDVVETILDLTRSASADLLVIGARRRSPLGKFVLGSVTQSLILDSEIPVLVVKSPAPGDAS